MNKLKNYLSLLLLAVFTVFFTISNASAHQNKLKGSDVDYYKVMGEYLSLKENINSDFKFTKQSIDPATGVTKQDYIFNSQIWPKVGPKSERMTWSHKVSIYIPSSITSKQALLWINSGTKNKPDNNIHSPLFDPYPLDFYKIASKSKSLVIDLHDVPNQYVTLSGKQWAEDALIAYTWSKFIDNPLDNKFLPAYLPMVKAVVKTMDNVSKLENKNHNIKIDSFIIGGLSKRGMTTWLTALHDKRVKAIIPVSIDVLNFEKNIQHIYASLQDWPIALHDYYEQNVVQQLTAPNAKNLMIVNDPFKYIECNDCSKSLKNHFHNRAKIDKYIIAASGDDFFTPDSSKFYYKKLPGKNYIRYIPNSWHYIDNNIVTNAVISFLDKYNSDHNKLPSFKYHITKDIIYKNNYFINIESDQKPKAIILYQAQNKDKRDFRLANGIQYQQIKITPENYNKYLFKKSGIYKYKISINKPEHGWQASFVELEYPASNPELENFKLTSNIEILPKNYPAIIKNKTDKIVESVKTKIENVKQYGKRVIYN